MYKNTAFTLVELLITIAILSILATLGFMYVGENIRDSRDVVRLADLDNVEKTLEIYFIKNGSYPLPDENSEVVYQNNTLWNQGLFGDEVFRKIRRLSVKPVDPLYKTQYSYSVLNNKREYEISTIFEGDLVSFNPFIQQAQAAEKIAYSIGNFNKKIISNKQGNNRIILAIPSITHSSNTQNNIQDIINDNNLVIHGKSNLPVIYNQLGENGKGNINFMVDDFLIFDGEISQLQSPVTQRNFIKKLQDIYKNNPNLLTDKKYYELMGINYRNRSQVKEYIQRLSVKKVGGFEL